MLRFPMFRAQERSFLPFAMRALVPGGQFHGSAAPSLNIFPASYQHRTMISHYQPLKAPAASKKKIVVHTGKPWEDKCGIARLVRVGDQFNISITAFNAPTAAEQVKGILDQMDAAIKEAGGRGVADIMISHIISNDVPTYAAEIAAAHKAYMEGAGNIPASTITGGTFGAPWMLVEMWASGIIGAAPEVEIRRSSPPA